MKMYNIRLDYELIDYLRKKGSDKVRQILQDFKDGKIPSNENTTINQPLTIQSCFYRVDDPTNEQFIYCDLKRIPKAVCENLQKRYASVNRKCYPRTIRRKPYPQRRLLVNSTNKEGNSPQMIQPSPLTLQQKVARLRLQLINCPKDNNMMTPTTLCIHCSLLNSCETIKANIL